MKNRLVIGLDSSTQSTKAVAWSVAGDMVAEGRADIPMSTPRRGYFEQDPNAWWAAACTALKEVCAQIDLTCLDGLAISNPWGPKYSCELCWACLDLVCCLLHCPSEINSLSKSYSMRTLSRDMRHLLRAACAPARG